MASDLDFAAGRSVTFTLNRSTDRAVLGVVALAVALSCAMHWVPVLNTVSSGFSIILCTVLAAGLGALAAPVPDEPSGAPDGEVA